MNIPEKLTKEEARVRLAALDADPDAIDWGNVRAALASAEAEVAAWPELLRGLPVEKTLAILRAHVAYLDAPDEGVRDVTYIVWTAPEPEAGLPGERAEVRLFGADMEDGEQVRKGLAETFGRIWGLAAKHVHVDVVEDPAATAPWATYPAEMERKAVLAAAVGAPGAERAPPTPSAARAALLDAAHTALSALKSFEAVMAKHEDAKVGEDLAMPLSFIRGTVRGAIGMIESRLPPVERTPEVVLRAMERACGLASVDAWRAFYQAQRAQCRAGTVEAAQAVRGAHAEGTAADFRHAFVGAELARCLEDGPDYEATVVEPMASDYLRRLDGSTPLDAPPLG